MKLKSTREIQLVLLEDYQTVAEIWSRHNYYFCLTGGSVLGAIRHNGFIPWDDDFDVGLSRKDYNDFVYNTAKELPDYLKLYLRKKTQQHVIFDTRYELDYNQEEIDALFEGTSEIAYPTLDLQIFDGTPNNRLHRFLFCLHIMLLRARIKMSDPEKIHTASWRPGWENLAIKILKQFMKKGGGADHLIERYKKLISKYQFKDSKYIADFIGKYHFKDIYPKRWWDPVINHDFESITVPIPNGFHEYLSQIYGDYMIIPDESHKVRHTAIQEEKDNG